MIVDLRPYLNEINKNNKNIKSFPFTAFGIEVASVLPYTRKISGPSWLDLSKEKFSIYVPEKDILVKISYHLIIRVHFVQNSNTMQVCSIYSYMYIETMIYIVIHNMHIHLYLKNTGDKMLLFL
jgi:hypothetical protein